MSDQISNARKVWAAPKVRVVVPAKRTFGGSFVPNDQDDAFYNNS